MIAGDAPQTFWMPAFFQPRNFLAAIKLDFARRHALAAEDVTIDFEIVNDRYYSQYGVINPLYLL